jgi:hypothetical protein
MYQQILNLQNISFLFFIALFSSNAFSQENISLKFNSDISFPQTDQSRQIISFRQSEKIDFNRFKTNNQQRFSDLYVADSILQERWVIANKEWLNLSKTINSYDEFGNKVRLKYYNFYISTGWELQYELRFTYDSNNNLLNEIFYKYDNLTQEFKATENQSYTYDENNNNISFTYNRWNIELQDWVPSFQDVFIYDAQNRMIEEKNYRSGSTGELEIDAKVSYSYDENGQQYMNINYDWDAESNQFIPVSKGLKFYNNSGDLDYMRFENWDSNNDLWYLGYLYDHTYDTKNQLIEYVVTKKAKDSYEMYESQKMEYEYDVNGNQVLRIYYTKEQDNIDWLPVSKYEDFYSDEDVNYQSVTYHWNADSSQWIPSTRTTNFIKNISIPDDPSDPGADIIIYPNPVKDNLNIDFIGDFNKIRFKLYDLNGRIIMNIELPDKRSIDLKDLPPAAYIYKVSVIGDNPKNKTGFLTTEN